MEKLPEVKVLPFSYGLDDPRYWHVESTEGRAELGNFVQLIDPDFGALSFGNPTFCVF